MWVLVAVFGCSPSHAIEQSAVYASNDADLAVLLAMELGRHVDDDTTVNGCPTTKRKGTDTAYKVTSTYAACAPADGLVPVALDESVDLSFADDGFSSTIADLGVGTATTAGTLGGTYVRADMTELGLSVSDVADFSGPAPAHIEATVTLTAPDADAGSAATNARIDGTSTVSYDHFPYPVAGAPISYAMTWTAVRMPIASVADGCPLPNGGTLAVVTAGHTVTLTFDTDTPSSGDADLLSGSRHYTAHLCDQASELY